MCVIDLSLFCDTFFDTFVDGQKSDTQQSIDYEVATISRLPKNIGLFCKRALYKRLYFAKETYIFKEPTNHSHPIVTLGVSLTENDFSFGNGLCVCVCECHITFL